MGGGAGIGIGSGASIAPAPSSTSAMSISSRKLIEDKSLPPVGLKNVGNTCYANAALQCILSTALSHALLDPTSTHIFRRYSSNPGLLAMGSGSVDTDNEATDDEDPADLLKEGRRVERQRAKDIRKRNKEKMVKHEKCQWLTGELTDITRVYTASNLNLDENKSNWQGMFHLFSDTNDLRVVDPGGVTRHVNKISPCLRPYQQEDAHEFLRSLLSTLTLDGQNKQLSSLCDGLLESAVTCQTCHRASVTRDRYMDLSLDIQGEIQDLTGALNHFTQTEFLDEHNKVDCARCKTRRVVSKGLRLATAPTVLVCHLKRFAFDKYGRATRLSKHVKYPLRLEIGEFMSRANQSKPPPYELVGVLVHAGRRCESGHYLAFIKCGDFWYKANDEVVTKVDIDVVLRQQAYILFYEVEGMRAKHGYEGFRKYHGQRRRDSASGNLPRSTEPVSPPDKITSILDSMLHLCGSVETVRDAFCDSDRKPKKNKEGAPYLTGLESYTESSFPPTSPNAPPLKKKSSKKSKDSIFRKSCSNGPMRSVSDRGTIPDPLKDYDIQSKSDLSMLSADSPMIRSVSSNNILEREEEVMCCYEKESYALNPSFTRERSLRSISPIAYRYNADEVDRKSDTAVPLARPKLFRRKSNSAPRSRIEENYDSPNKNLNQSAHQILDQSAHHMNLLPPLPRRPA
mmetsp:Transcript_26779/g.39666  ORF Transcript_26779/g.39666 Transcript_26779/m.39666 type:complete len:684 (+) Transcript_26779:189-2240(+)